MFAQLAWIPTNLSGGPKRVNGTVWPHLHGGTGSLCFVRSVRQSDTAVGADGADNAGLHGGHRGLRAARGFNYIALVSFFGENLLWLDR